MTTTRFLAGFVLAAAALGPVVASAYALRRRYLPQWIGSLGRLVEVVLGATIVIVVLEVLGLVHLYETAPAVLALALTGAAITAYAARGSGTREASGPLLAPEQVLGRAGTVVAVLATAIVVAAWATRVVDAVHHGMATADTLWYHMPVAAGFVQQGWIGSLHFVDSEPVTAFFPANSPLVHGLGILLFGSDVLSPFLDFGWLAVALLAGWCIGRPYRVGPATLTGVALVVATPGMVATQPGGALTDIVVLAFLLTAVAILVNAYAASAKTPVRCNVVAALASGIALGSKFTALGAIAALAVAAIWLAPRARRVPVLAAWIVGLLLTGSLWYLRNLVIAGNPLPELAFGVGPLSLRTVTGTTPTYSVAQYLLDASVWREYFIPGMNSSLGPAWPALVTLMLAGLILGTVAGGSRVQRAIALVGTASFVAFLFTPQFLGFAGAPFFFLRNVRYASPALSLGLCVLPTIPLLSTRRRAWWVLGGYGAVLIATQLDSTIWPYSWRPGRFEVPIRGLDSLAGALVGVGVLVAGLVIVLRPTLARHARSWIAVAAIAVIVVVVGTGVHTLYVDRRYANTTPLPNLYAWARNIHDSRIALVGPYLQLQYPFYGKHLDNTVQYVGTPLAHGDFRAITDCAAWRTAINNGHYRYVVISSDRERAWTDRDPNVTRLAVGDRFRGLGDTHVFASLYRIDGRLSPDTCAPAKT
jgi:hypothetical protein